VSDQLKNDLAVSSESFLDVVSPLLAGHPLKVNLIPEEVKLRKSFQEKSEDLVKTGILVMMLLAVICVIFISKIYFKTAYLKNLSQKFSLLIQQAKSLEKDFSRMEVIRTFMKDRDIPLDVLVELYNLIPEDIRFNAIKYTTQGKFSVAGNARTMATVFSFLSHMEESSYFKNGELKRTTKRKEGEEEVVDFEIVCLLEENPTPRKK
jgi:Tfp pilus assembly protein PilN